MDPKTQVAVVGATGAVGGELLSVLAESGHPGEAVTALASPRSGGAEAEYGDETLEVEVAGKDSFRQMGVVFLAAPADVARQLGPAAQAAGAWVIDVSAAFREDPTVPMVGGPEVGIEVLAKPFKGRIVGSASPVVSALAAILEPLRKGPGVRRVTATAMLGTALEGGRGIAELEKEVAGLLSGRETEAELFPFRVAFNVVPQVGVMKGDWSREEIAWEAEVKRLWGDHAPIVTGTAIQVPTFFGHALALDVETAGQPSVDDVRGLLKSAVGLKVLDVPAERVYPMPMLVSQDPAVQVGRIRAVPGAPGRFLMFAAFESARRAASAAFVAAEALLRQVH